MKTKKDINKLQEVNHDGTILYLDGNSGEYFDKNGEFVKEAENWIDYEDINEPISELE